MVKRAQILFLPMLLLSAIPVVGLIEVARSEVVASPQQSSTIEQINQEIKRLRAVDPGFAILAENAKEVDSAYRELVRIIQGNPDAVSYILQLLKDANPQVRHIAVDAVDTVGRVEFIGEPAKLAISQLTLLLKDSDQEVRRRTSYTLGRMGKSTILQLLPLLKDSNQDTRSNAAYVLSIVGKPAIPVLTPLLKDSDPGIRWRAACALGRMGESAQSAVPELISLLKDIDPNVRWLVAYGLSSRIC